MIGGMQGMGCRTDGMQDRWDTKPEGCMTGRMQERKDEGMKGRWDEEK